MTKTTYASSQLAYHCDRILAIDYHLQLGQLEMFRMSELEWQPGYFYTPRVSVIF